MQQFIPALGWLKTYTREDLTGDLTAGIIVAIMLVPQAMAYALLADLPPQVGLYTAILPLIVYGIFGTSSALAMGPVAIVSLMTGEALGAFEAIPLEEKLLLAVTLAAMVGVIQLVLGLIKAGAVVNFLSHPVLSGFASAAAIVIGVSQLKHLLGLPIPRTEFTHQQVVLAVQNAADTNLVTLGIGLSCIAILIGFRYGLAALLRRSDLPDAVTTPIVRMAPLVVVLFGTLTVAIFNLDAAAGVAIVGQVPSGPPELTLPTLSLSTLSDLLPAALAISFVGYMEGISVAKALASKRRQRIEPNQEMVATGLANLAAAFTGGYPVAGGLARSAVNFAAGARTGLASIITAALMLATVIFLMPLFFYLPQAALAAIIMVAVTNLIDLDTARLTLRVNKADFGALAVTFATVLLVGVETGILAGLAVSIALYLWRTSQPHIAIVGQVGETEHYRNVRNFNVQTWPNVLAIRVDESLYFANTQALEGFLLNAVADHPEVDDVVLVCSAINYVDTSALETLETLTEELHDAGVRFHMAEVKIPVRKQLEKARFFEHSHTQTVFLSTHEAMVTLGCCLDAP